MAYNEYMQTFEVRNKDISIKFSCPNHGKRIRECISNLDIDVDDKESNHKMESFFGSNDADVQFRFCGDADKNAEWITDVKDITAQALFFENTDYPVRILTNHNAISLERLVIGKEENCHVVADDDIIFGTINYGNQVGRTDIKVIYKVNNIEKSLSFSTEVLSYKMDYRTDMRQVILDIEEEFSMLSYSLLKETYQTFKQANKETSDLIWWQIFQDCYKHIVEAADYIINRPKRKLKSNVRFERAERLPYIPYDLENEYAEFQNNPNHLYRIEDMVLSRDTIENRFLKYALLNISDRFKKVKQNILSILNADNISMRKAIENMDDEINRLIGNPFFRGIGTFKGFTQDSLVMKQAHGYKEIYEYWIILQCGYELQEGIMRLEVKEISELYEIWCFIKVKNMVQHILRDKATMQLSGHQTKGDFIKKLVQGKSSDVRFIDKQNSEIVLASVMYNATSDDEAIMNFDPSKQKTDIAQTTSKTTEQRPDIVLRLSRDQGDIQYTYLFDAKYRLNDTRIFNLDVPPVDAINQMHRYRDAIYYTESSDQKLKKEVIGGYVLYPGNLNADSIKDSYYYKSIQAVNIGAYPLKPGGCWHSVDDELLLDPTSAEDVLYKQIFDWLNQDHPKQELLETSIPQKGLYYTDSKPKEGIVLFITPDKDVNTGDNLTKLKEDRASVIFCGQKTHERIHDLTRLRYVVVVVNGEYHGWYPVKKAEFVSVENVIQPMRLKITLEAFEQFPEKRISGNFGSNLAAGVTYAVCKAVKFRKDWKIE